MVIKSIHKSILEPGKFNKFYLIMSIFAFIGGFGKYVDVILVITFSISIIALCIASVLTIPLLILLLRKREYRESIVPYLGLLLITLTWFLYSDMIKEILAFD